MSIHIRIGIPTHFLPGDQNLTACGLVGAAYTTSEAAAVNCMRCRKTKAWKAARRSAGATKKP